MVLAAGDQQAGAARRVALAFSGLTFALSILLLPRLLHLCLLLFWLLPWLFFFGLLLGLLLDFSGLLDGGEGFKVGEISPSSGSRGRFLRDNDGGRLNGGSWLRGSLNHCGDLNFGLLCWLLKVVRLLLHLFVGVWLDGFLFGNLLLQLFDHLVFLRV